MLRTTHVTYFWTRPTRITNDPEYLVLRLVSILSIGMERMIAGKQQLQGYIL